MMREAHRDYTAKIESRMNEDPRSFWNLVKIKKKDKSVTSIYVHKNEELTEPHCVVDAFATHFRSVFGNPVSYPSTYDDIHSEHPVIKLHRVTVGEVEEALKIMKPKRAVGPDGVPQYIYKACGEFLIAPLTHVFNLAICTSTFPYDWTITAITPVPKTTNTTNIADHRPITSMPIANKIFEKVIFRQLYPQVHRLIAEQQHGFVRNRTVETNLLEFTHYICETLDKKSQNQVDVVYTDLQKAFDKVNHEMLLRKLLEWGFSMDTVLLLGSYFRQSRQYVVFNGLRSGTFRCTTGVPQGGNLAPFLFVIYVNEIPRIIKHSKCLLFADDLKIYKEINTVHDAEDFQADVLALEQWTGVNHLPLNVKKCKTVTYTRRRDPITMQYTIQGEVLDRVDEIRDLGVLMERNLKYTKQFNKVKTTAKRTIGLIKRFSGNLKRTSTIRLLYFALVRSQFDFANTVWGPQNGNDLNALEAIQKQLLKYLYYRDFMYYDSEITYRELVLGYEMNTLRLRRDLFALRQLYKIINGIQDTSYLLSKINIHVPPRASRMKGLFRLSRARTEILSNSPLERMMALYNILTEINNEIDIFFDNKTQFEKNIVQALVQHYA